MLKLTSIRQSESEFGVLHTNHDDGVFLQPASLASLLLLLAGFVSPLELIWKSGDD